MKAASYTIPFTSGDDVLLPMRIRTAVFNNTTQIWEPGPAVDLTGWTAHCEFRPVAGGTPIEVATVLIDADQVTNTGMIYLSLTEAQTLVIADAWVYDVELIDPSGFKQTYVTGKTKVKIGVG